MPGPEYYKGGLCLRNADKLNRHLFTNSTSRPMKTKPTFRRSQRSLVGFTAIHFIAAAELLLSALGTVTGRADILYVADPGSDTIKNFTSDGVGSVFASSGLNAPFGLAFDSAGNLYAANFGKSTIEKFTPGGVGSVFASSSLSAPFGLAFDSAGNLYAANNANNTIEKFTPGGVGSVFASSGLSSPVGLAFDSAGNLYAANNGTNSIEKFTPGGVGSVFASTGLNNPIGVAFDSSGNLYVANSGDDTIEKFTPRGVGSVFANSGLSKPYGLAFDSAGNLYATNRGADEDDGIERFTSDGIASVFVSASTGLNQASDLAFTTDSGMPLLGSVPEPCTAFFGIALCGLSVLRRRRSAPRQCSRTFASPAHRPRGTFRSTDFQTFGHLDFRCLELWRSAFGVFRLGIFILQIPRFTVGTFRGIFPATSGVNAAAIFELVRSCEPGPANVRH